MGGDDHLSDEQEKDSTTIKPKPKSGGRKAPPKDGLKGAIKEEEIQRSFYYFFRMWARLRKSDADFDESEFADIAKTLASLAERFPVLKVLLIFLAPFSALGTVIDIIVSIEERSQKAAAARLARMQKQGG